MNNENTIAIVGMALKVPGADNLSEFWQNLCDGKESIGHVSKDDLAARGESKQNLDDPNYVCRVGRLNNPEMFDAGYFSFTNREAHFADPQLRVLLEVCQHAVEDSGHILDGTRTGVCVGVADNNYWLSNLYYNSGDESGESLSNYIYIKKDFFATQLSHKLNLLGGSKSIYSACSTSLVALHEAANQLLMYECDFSIVGSCDIEGNGLGHLYKEGNILSKDGYCRAFDKDASGTIFTSGCGVLILRRFEDAVRDKDNIYALIRTTRINNDGSHKAGYTAPSIAGQSQVISEAIEIAEVDAGDITYVETHGTGTKVGDPIEIQALTNSFRRKTDKKQFCGIGSVKTNIGHLGVAAGIPGLIKTALALKNAQIPPSLHFSHPNPSIDFKNSPFYVVSKLQSWQRNDDKPLLAGVSAFGVGGTNAHAILQEAPKRESGDLSSRPYQLIMTSAKSKDALRQLRTDITKFLGVNKDVSIPDVAYTLQVGRKPLSHRCVGVLNYSGDHGNISSSIHWIEKLQEAKPKPKIVFMFPGQGAQYVGMSHDIYKSEKVFKESVDKCAELMKAELGLDIRSLLYPAGNMKDIAESQLQETRYTQPALFVVEYALAKLLLSWGIVPESMIGHSIGEYVAACLAGVFTLDDCIKIVVARGRLMQTVSETGAMLSVSSTSKKIEKYLGDKIELAAVNSPMQCVLAGDKGEIEELEMQFKSGSIRTSILRTSHAFHSYMMEEILDDFEAVFKNIMLSSPKIKFISNFTGRFIEDEEAVSPLYWRNHLRNTVLFHDGITQLDKQGVDIYIEVGPGKVLSGLLGQADIEAISTMRSAKDSLSDNEVLMGAVAEIWIAGAEIAWGKFYFAEKRNRLSLPAYPFQRKRYWVEPQEFRFLANSLARKSLHPLLGQQWSKTEFIKSYENFVSANNPSYLKDHRLMETSLFPGAAYCEMALACARLQLGNRPVRFNTISFERALMLNDSESKPIQTVVFQKDDESFQYEITSLVKPRKSAPEGAWQLHSRGTFRALEQAPHRVLDLEALKARIKTPDPMVFYDFDSVKFGPCFQCITGLWVEDNEILGRAELPEILNSTKQDYCFHPALLDACFQAIGAYTYVDYEKQKPALPIGLVDFDLYGEIPTEFWFLLTADREAIAAHIAGGAMSGTQVTVMDNSGKVLASIRRYERTELTSGLIDEPEFFEDLFYQMHWKEQEPELVSEQDNFPSHTVLITDDSNIGNSICGEIKEKWKSQVGLINFIQENDIKGKIKDVLIACKGSADNKSIEVVFLHVNEDLSDVYYTNKILLDVIRAINSDVEKPQVNLSIITRGAQKVGGNGLSTPHQVAASSIWGFGTAVCKEHADLHCIRIDLDPIDNINTSMLLRDLLRTRNEDLVAYRGVTRYVARIRHLDSTLLPLNEDKSFRIMIPEFGTFDALQEEIIERVKVGENDVEVEIFSAGLNFKETLITLGMLDLGYSSADVVPLGFEGAGRIVSVGEGVTEFDIGDSVIVWGNGCLRSHTTINKNNVVKFDPNVISFDQAAVLPTVFMTVNYGLHSLARIKSGDRILIHAAAGGIGLSAIQLAKQAGAEIFATASRGKWDFLRQLGIENIYDSRSLEFSAEIIRDTNGQGVDIVLNSLTGEFIPKNFDALAQGGRMVEIGKLNIWTQEQAKKYRPDVQYFPFELGEGAATSANLLDDLLTPILDGFKNQSIKGLPLRIFSVEETISAFRWLAAGKNIGKAVIRLRSDKKVPVLKSNQLIKPERQYLVTGGLGALGLHVAEWLLEKGAKNIILISRRPPDSEVSARLGVLESMGAKILVENCDIANKEQLESVIKKASSLSGVFHCAGVLDDGIIINQTHERFDKVLLPKVTGALNLHELTKNLELDYFVCYSSTSAYLDGAGQCNYSAANAYLDGLIHYRRTLGLPGLAINWGGWDGAGMAAKLKDRRPKSNSDFIQKDEGMKGLELLMSRNIEVAIFSRMTARLKTDGKIYPMYQDLIKSLEHSDSSQNSFEQVLESNRGNVLASVKSILKNEVGKVLGLDVSEFDEDDDFVELGTDSLMLAELRNNVQKFLSKSVSIAAYFANPSVSALARYIVLHHFSDGQQNEALEDESTATGVTVLKESETGSKIFCIPGVGTSTFAFKPLADSVENHSICVLAADEEIYEDLKENVVGSQAKKYVERILKFQEEGPYHILGYSGGGTTAIEVAHLLQIQDKEVKSLVLVDAVPFFQYRNDLHSKRSILLVMFDSVFEALKLSTSDVNQFYQELEPAADDKDWLGRFKKILREKVASELSSLIPSDELIDMLPDMVNIDYTPPKDLGPLVVRLVKSTRSFSYLSDLVGLQIDENLISGESAYGWEKILDNKFIAEQLDASHMGILQAPSADNIAQVFENV